MYIEKWLDLQRANQPQSVPLFLESSWHLQCTNYPDIEIEACTIHGQAPINQINQFITYPHQP